MMTFLGQPQEEVIFICPLIYDSDVCDSLIVFLMIVLIWTVSKAGVLSQSNELTRGPFEFVQHFRL